MAHPDLLMVGRTGQEAAGYGRVIQEGQSILALLPRRDLPAKRMCHQLLAIADPKHRYIQIENRRIHYR
jgi:hypothetical protein